MQPLDINVIVSSWPGAGGTTMALIIADYLKLKYIYAGGVLREWARRMDYDTTSDKFHQWEASYGENWDAIWEAYIYKKFTSTKNLLAEGKTAGFLLPDGAAFEVMVIANEAARNQRAGGDGRSETLASRDQLLQNRWSRSYNVDIFNLAAIQANYDLLLDNSTIGIADGVIKTLTALQTYLNAANLPVNFTIAEAKLHQLEADYWQMIKRGEKPKEKLKDKLFSQGLYISNDEVFNDFKTVMKDTYLTLPSEMQIF